MFLLQSEYLLMAKCLTGQCTHSWMLNLRIILMLDLPGDIKKKFDILIKYCIMELQRNKLY